MLKQVKSLVALKVVMKGGSAVYVPSKESPFSMYAGELNRRVLDGMKTERETYNEAFVKFIGRFKNWCSKDMGETVSWWVEEECLSVNKMTVKTR